jgi:histidine phosphotransferase ChpT
MSTPLTVDRAAALVEVRAPAAARGDTATPAADLGLAQLLCARLCHDLIGPAGALGVGLEFLRGEAAGDAGAFDLVEMSAGEIKARLSYYRAAFGPTGGAGLSLDHARRLAEGLLRHGRVRLDWDAPADDDAPAAPVAGDVSRLILCLILVAADALPRGGVVSVAAEGEGHDVHVRIDACGRGARIPEHTASALAATDAGEIGPRGLPAFYVRRLVEALGDHLVVSQVADQRVTITTGPASRPGTDYGVATAELASRAPQFAEALSA